MIVTYRLPSYDLKLYCHQLENILQTVNNENKLICLSGDLNVNLAVENSSNDKQHLNQLTSSYNRKPLIYIPTRISNNKQSIIDNI